MMNGIVWFILLVIIVGGFADLFVAVLFPPKGDIWNDRDEVEKLRQKLEKIDREYRR